MGYEPRRAARAKETLWMACGIAEEVLGALSAAQAASGALRRSQEHGRGQSLDSLPVEVWLVPAVVLGRGGGL